MNFLQVQIAGACALAIGVLVAVVLGVLDDLRDESGRKARIDAAIATCRAAGGEAVIEVSEGELWRVTHCVPKSGAATSAAYEQGAR